MFRSLHMKLTLILLLLITSLMAVVGAFLTTSVTSFYIDSFYQQMSSAFGADRKAFVADLRSAAGQPDGADRIQEIHIKVIHILIMLIEKEMVKA